MYYICTFCKVISNSDDSLPIGWVNSYDEHGNKVELCCESCKQRYDAVISIRKEKENK